MNLRRRIKALESRTPKTTEPYRVILCWTSGDTDLTRSTCRRYYSSDGVLNEFVRFWGSGKDLSAQDLERFIASFPIEPAAD